MLLGISGNTYFYHYKEHTHVILWASYFVICNLHYFFQKAVAGWEKKGSSLPWPSCGGQVRKRTLCLPRSMGKARESVRWGRRETRRAMDWCSTFGRVLQGAWSRHPPEMDDEWMHGCVDGWGSLWQTVTDRLCSMTTPPKVTELVVCSQAWRRRPTCRNPAGRGRSVHKPLLIFTLFLPTDFELYF